MTKIEVKYKVDKGVPVPVRRDTMPLDSLEVGESIGFPVEKRASVQAYASKLKSRKGKVFTVHYSPELDDCRVWRVK